MYSSVRMIPVVHLTEIMLRSYLQKNRKEEAVKEAARKCPYCKSVVEKDATRCPHCTSDIEGK